MCEPIVLLHGPIVLLHGPIVLLHTREVFGLSTRELTAALSQFVGQSDYN